MTDCSFDSQQIPPRKRNGTPIIDKRSISSIIQWRHNCNQPLSITINDNKMCPFTTIQPLNLIPVAGNQLVITFSASQWTNSFRTHAKSPPLTQVKSFRLDARTLNHMLMKLVRLQSISLAGCGQRRRSSVRTFLPPTDWIRPRKKMVFKLYTK